MKKYILSFLLLLSILFTYAQDPAYPVAPAAPPVINAAEYFIDNDPGLGAGTAIAVTPGVNIANLAAAINVSSLQNGTHRLVIRVRSADGKWSIVSIRDFLYDADFVYPTAVAPPQNIVAAEYFINNDPGVGAGTAVTVTPALDLSNLNVTVNTAGLSNGTHRIYLRVKSAEGKWSVVSYREFVVDFNPDYPLPLTAAGNLVALEYFIDTDPGPGNGEPITITAATDIANLTTAVNTTGLSMGTHRLYLRGKNSSGAWSIVSYREFGVENAIPYPAAPVAAENVIAAEYFIDTDPGYGLGNNIAITPGVELANINVGVTTGSLVQGIHRLYVRTKNNEGRWSVVSVREFVVSNDFSYPATPIAAGNIIAAEYFIDTDPGYGLGNNIPVTPATDIANLNVSVATNNLSTGEHHIYLRTLSAEGKWSVVSQAKFFTDLLAISPDTLRFGNLVLGTTNTLPVTVTNNSNVPQTINSITINGDFSTAVTAPVTIAANSSTVIDVVFTPVAIGAHIDSVVVQTSAGKYKTVLTGSAIAIVNSWAITPGTGHNYGNVIVGSTSSYNYTVTNTGNAAITLQNITTGNAVFTPTFVPGTVIAPGTSYVFSVGFTPATVMTYAAELRLVSSTAGVTDGVTQLQGAGYVPGTAPVINYITAAPYTSTNGVAPNVGQAGDYVYKVLYSSAANLPPQAGYPKVSIDLNGNQTFNDINEGEFTMQQETASTDYITGVVYTYTFTHQQLTSQAGYKFTAIDQNGNNATGTGVVYKSGPIVTNDQIDLRLFANDITFSNANPNPTQAFTVTARITNNTAVPATNVPVRLYVDTIPLMDLVLPAINANSTASISQTLTFATEGFYPIKVWVDSSNTLGDINTLNNYAIRPVIVGRPLLPGSIIPTVNITVQRCPQLSVIFTGNAKYDGTSTATNVAGATVTIEAGGQVFTTTTDVNGDYRYVLTGVTCGNFMYKATITDYTLTAKTVDYSTYITCPTANECLPPVPPPSQGGVVAHAVTQGCQNMVGNSAGVNMIIKFRERNVSNMWSGWDKITTCVLKIYVDGNLVETLTPIDGTYNPGDVVTIPYNFPLTSTAQVNVSAIVTYTYVEYLQIPDNFYHGIRTNHTATGAVPITPQPDLADLTVTDFVQTDMVSFRFNNRNNNCPDVGAHTVRVYDSIPNGAVTLIQTYNVASVAGKSYVTLTYRDSSFTPGTHFIKVVTDYDGVIAEENENNNTVVFTMVVPAPDLSVGKISLQHTDVVAGQTTRISATIRNIGKFTENFGIRFSLGGTQIGGIIPVAFIGSNDSIVVYSGLFTVTSPAALCAGVITVTADALSVVTESNESNNTATQQLAADLTPLIYSHEVGAIGNPVVVRVNTRNQFFPSIRNMGIRDVDNVTVRYELGSDWIGNSLLPKVKAGAAYVAFGSFNYEFTTPGNYVIRVTVDTANAICEVNETNNQGNYYIRVVDSKPDLVVLSEYINPSSLNPNPNQTFTVVGTVRNSGGKPTIPTSLRFMVEGTVLGADVPINVIQPGRDTTVAATVGYASTSDGLKVLRLIADPLNLVDEEIETNNEATRTIIVGDAPDIAENGVNAITFNPNGFVAGDSVNVNFNIKNFGTQPTSGWVRFTIRDEDSTVLAIDSTQFGLLMPNQTTIVTRKMLFDVAKGLVEAQIYNTSLQEYDVNNNYSKLYFNKIVMLRNHIVVNGNLDLEEGAPEQLPGWIGGQIVLGDYDLTINGNIQNADSAHFVVTNGAGKLTLINNHAMNVYPVGTSLTSPNFVELNNTGTQDNFSVRVTPYVLQRGNSGDTVKVGNVNRTWFINEQVTGGSNVAATFYWSQSHELPGFDRPASRTAHYTNKWELGTLGDAVLATNGQFTKTQTDFTGFSPFTVTSGSGAALPLQLLTFTATPKQNNVLLQWSTTNEINTQSFVVEHSKDGITYTSVGTVAAVNTSGNHQYLFEHNDAGEGVHYYRLKMKDIDGAYTYSFVATAKINQPVLIVAYPNPVQSTLYLKNTPAGTVIQLLAQDGKLIRQQTAQGTLTNINMQSLPAGVYLVQCLYNQTKTQFKIVKQ